MKQIEKLFFHIKGLQFFEKGGLLIYLTGSNFYEMVLVTMRQNKKSETIGDLIDAYRLPPVFTYSKVPTDIIILRKR